MREIKFRVWNDYTNEMRYTFEGFTNEFDVLNLTKFFNEEHDNDLIYQGFIDDARNTGAAWYNARVTNFHTNVCLHTNKSHVVFLLCIIF